MTRLSRSPKPEARSPKPEARSPKPEARSPKPVGWGESCDTSKFVLIAIDKVCADDVPLGTFLRMAARAEAVGLAFAHRQKQYWAAAACFVAVTAQYWG